MIQEEIFLSTLVQRGIIKKEDAPAILEEAKSLGKRVEDVILKKDPSKEKEIAQIKSELFKLPLKIFSPHQIIPQKILSLIPEDTARHYKFVAFGKEGNILDIGMVHPDDLKAQQVVQFTVKRLGLGMRIFIILPSSLNTILKQYQSFTQDFQKLIADFQAKYASRKQSSPSYRVVDIESTAGVVAEEAPIVKLVASILKYAVRLRASDIHIEPMRDKIRVRFRIDGKLSTILTLPPSIHQAIISRIKIMSRLKIDETRRPQDGRFSTIVDEKGIDFRISTFPTALGEKVAIRVLDPTTGLKDIRELGLEGKDFTILNTEIHKPYGMILISGPTGSGKTTTLYSIMQILNQDKSNVVSLEDPVEYTIEGVNQSQVVPEIGYTFARGLRQIVRQDPDIIMVGEIRDTETAELATHAALTGHLVLSTIHTNNAIGVIPRLIDMGVKPFLLPSAVNLMIAQRLVRRLRPDCREKILATEKEQEIIENSLHQLPSSMREKLPYKKPYYVYRPKKTPACQGKGYLGRIAIFELFEMTPAVENIVLSQPSPEKLLGEAKKQGMITLRQDGILKALAGVVSLEEVLSITEKY